MPHRAPWPLSRLAVAGALGVLAASAGAQYSTPVRDVENPARTRFMDSGVVTMGPGSLGTISSIVTVPAGKRLVIEQVSVRCTQDAGAFISAQVIVSHVTGASTATLGFDIPLQFQGVDVFDGRSYVGSMPTRLYADPGTPVNARATRDSAGGTGTCGFAISGHTVVP